MGGHAAKHLPKGLMEVASLNEYGGYSWEGTLKQGDCKIKITYNFKKPLGCAVELPSSLIAIREDLGWPTDAFGISV